MICFSRVLATKMLDYKRLVEALTALGINVERVQENAVVSSLGVFYRSKASEGFTFQGTDFEQAKAVGRKYAEISARAWGARRGFSVTKTEANRITMTKRR